MPVSSTFREQLMKDAFVAVLIFAIPLLGDAWVQTSWNLELCALASGAVALYLVRRRMPSSVSDGMTIHRYSPRTHIAAAIVPIVFLSVLVTRELQTSLLVVQRRPEPIVVVKSSPPAASPPISTAREINEPVSDHPRTPRETVSPQAERVAGNQNHTHREPAQVGEKSIRKVEHRTLHFDESFVLPPKLVAITKRVVPGDAVPDHSSAVQVSHVIGIRANNDAARDESAPAPSAGNNESENTDKPRTKLKPRTNNATPVLASAHETYINGFPCVRLTMQNLSEDEHVVRSIDIATLSNIKRATIAAAGATLRTQGILDDAARLEVDVDQIEGGALHIDLTTTFTILPHRVENLLVMFVVNRDTVIQRPDGFHRKLTFIINYLAAPSSTPEDVAF